jgi:hypothetical protein
LPLDMTEKAILTWLITSGLILTLVRAEESPSAAPAAAGTPTRNVRISFVPPPMQGTISLGIYDDEGRLVRILRQEAELDEFEVGDDGLSVRWDGKDDGGYDLPAGKYRAHGYIVATKAEPVPIGGTVIGPPILETPMRVSLVRNPLEKNDAPSADLELDHDDENAYLKTADGLPLVTVATVGDVEYAAFINRSEQALTVLLRRPGDSILVKVSPISKMMAFDCGEFEVK